MQEDDTPPVRPRAANDDEPPFIASAQVDAALIRIAQAIGRQIARERISAQRAANDNGAMGTDIET